MNRRLLAILMSLGVVAICVEISVADPPVQGRPGPVDCSAGLAWWAIPSDTGHYLGYYVGGGCGRRLKAEPRRVDEGTWGWDYQGWLVPRRVVLDWWHGRRYQGGTGAYKSEGPKLYHPEEGGK